MLKASCLTLEINEFRCYEAKIEESGKAGSRRELNPGHLLLEPPVSALPLSKPLSMHVMKRIFWSTPNRVLMAHTEWLPFSTTCAVHVEDCEGWWLSACRGSVAKHWWLKPQVSCVRLSATACLFTFLYFRLITFISSVGKIL